MAKVVLTFLFNYTSALNIDADYQACEHKLGVTHFYYSANSACVLIYIQNFPLDCHSTQAG